MTAGSKTKEYLAAGFGKSFRDKDLATEWVIFSFFETADAAELSILQMRSTPSAFVPSDELRCANVVILRRKPRRDRDGIASGKTLKRKRR